MTKLKIHKKNLMGFLLCCFFIASFADPGAPILNLSQNNCDINNIDYANSVAFVIQLKSAIAMNNKSMIADMGSYPVRFNYRLLEKNKIKLVHKKIKNKKEFIDLYNEIFSSDLKNIILKQNPHDIFCNYKGAMIANGRIWFWSNKETAKFFAINNIE